jgi:hypothetical protein
MLHVAPGGTPVRTQQQSLTHPLRLRVRQGHDVLQLVAKAEGAAG